MGTIPQDHVVCNLCGGNDLAPWARRAEVPVVRCLSCGLVYTSPRPAADLLRSRYQGVYVDLHQDEGLLKQRRLMYGQERREILRRAAGGRFLDVGCGTGEFLALMADRFEVHGLDVSEPYIEYGRDRLGLANLHIGELHEVGLPDAYYDVVQMRGVLQHLSDPLAAVREALRVTRPGGLLVVSATPNIASICARLYRDRFRLLAPEFMLYNFSPATLRELLERAGWDVEQIVYPYLLTPYFRWWHGLQVLSDAVWMALERVPGVPSFDRSSPAFFGSMMTCYARKPYVAR